MVHNRALAEGSARMERYEDTMVHHESENEL